MARKQAWRQFVKQQRKKGLSFKQIGRLWRKQQK